MRPPVFINFQLIFCIFLTSVNGNIGRNQPIVEFYLVDGTQYVFFSQRVTWDEANMLCSTSNAKLAILDNLEKASAVAKAMSESNIAMEDAWLGGRRSNSGWIWIENNNITSNRYSIPSRSNIEEFPPWSRDPTRPSKECLAIDRKLHVHPNFVDLDCRLLRPYICEQKSNDTMNTPVPSKWVQVQKNTYILYHGRVTWMEAVMFCRSKGTRLAVIKNQNVINTLTNSMTKSRPDFESVWIGARFSHGQWTWLSTGSSLNPVTDETGYPPWRFGRSEKNQGCLLLDRHLENSTNFIEQVCDRKRDFVCEEYSPEELEEWMNEPLKFSYKNSTFIIYPFDKTWDESRLYCYERGSMLAYINNTILANLMVAAMGDHPKEISHIWLGGLYHTNKSEWKWIHNNEIIPTNVERNFPPWAYSIVDEDSYLEESLCLNLDRSDHTVPHFYGLECESKQPFACVISCEEPPTVRNGSWLCAPQSDVKVCSLECQPGFIMLGIQDVSCEVHSGWYNQPNWLEFPLCLDTSSYLKRMVKSLSQDLQKSSGYYVLISHNDTRMQNFSLEFTKRMLNLFPLSNYLKMGMTIFNDNLNIFNLYNQNDSCEVLRLLHTFPSETVRKNISSKKHSDWSQSILRNSREKVVLIAITDYYTTMTNQATFDRLRAKGHYVVTIGLKNDWTVLSPIATIGYDQRLNLYLFHEEELKTIINGLKHLHNSTDNCVRNYDFNNMLSLSDITQIFTGAQTDNESPNSIETITSRSTSNSALVTEENEVQITSTTEIATSGSSNFDEITDPVDQFESTTIETNEERNENPEAIAESTKNPPQNDIYRRIYMDREKNKNAETKPQQSTEHPNEGTPSDTEE